LIKPLADMDPTAGDEGRAMACNSVSFNRVSGGAGRMGGSMINPSKSVSS
jgi:hypothetical protein